MVNENTVKKMRARHVGEEEVNHYQTQRIHLFFLPARAAAAVKRGTSGWEQRTISSKCSWGG